MSRRRAVEAVLLDLDDTLVPEVEYALDALLVTARAAGIPEPHRLRDAVRTRCRELWWAHPRHDYALQIGLSSWEALWARFEGSHPDERALGAWAAEYRIESWRRALDDVGAADPELAARLAASFPQERRTRRDPFPDAIPALASLRAHGLRIGIVTNGLSCLQREKLRGAGLAPWIDAFVAGGDVGAAKPDPAPFRRALEALGVEAAHAAMAGNNPETDLAGGRAAGIGRLYWVRRGGPPTERLAEGSFSDLRDLAAAVVRDSP